MLLADLGRMIRPRRDGTSRRSVTESTFAFGEGARRTPSDRSASRCRECARRCGSRDGSDGSAWTVLLVLSLVRIQSAASCRSGKRMRRPVGVEDEDVARVDGEADRRTVGDGLLLRRDGRRCSPPATSDSVGGERPGVDVEQRLAAEALDDLHRRVDRERRSAASRETPPGGRRAATSAPVAGGRVSVAQRQRTRAGRCRRARPRSLRSPLAGDARLEEIHARRAEEAGDEEIARPIVELERRADLLDRRRALMTTMRSAMVIASVWSWVT